MSEPGPNPWDILTRMSEFLRNRDIATPEYQMVFDAYQEIAILRMQKKLLETKNDNS